MTHFLLIKKFPKSENLSFYLYIKGCLADKIEEAKSCFKEVIQINSWSYYVIQSYIKLSWIAVKNKDFELALQYLNNIEIPVVPLEVQEKIIKELKFKTISLAELF